MIDLSDVLLLRGVSRDVIEGLRPIFGAPKAYEKDEAIMALEQEGRRVFVLVEGTARLNHFSEDGGVVSFHDIEVGDYFGWIDAIDGHGRLKSAVALSPCQVLSLSHDAFMDVLQRDPVILENFLKRATGVIRRYTARINDLNFLSAKDRITKELARRFEEEGGSITIKSHEDLASWVGTTRETVSRVMKILEGDGVIAKDGHLYALLKKLDLYESTQ